MIIVTILLLLIVQTQLRLFKKNHKEIESKHHIQFDLTTNWILFVFVVRYACCPPGKNLQWLSKRLTSLKPLNTIVL